MSERLPGRRRRQLVSLRTPEHVPVSFEPGQVSARAAALVIDGFILMLGLFAVWMVTLVVTGILLPSSGSATSIATASATVASFLLRTFYFASLELRARGQTIGKQLLGLQVIARDGGPLTAEMVVARNLTREFELFIPLMMLVMPENLGGLPPLARLATLVWVCVLLGMPVLNRHRARAGDLLAGTMVVRTPKGTLLRDLIERDRPSGYTFTAEQLDLYGIRELQVLEQILRDRLYDTELLADVAGRICTKLEITEEVQPRPFLEAFYAAQRGRLEQKMIMGTRQEEKIR